MRRYWHISVGVLVAVTGSAAGADVTLLTQQRTLLVATSADGNTQTASAPDFAPFVATLTISAPFQSTTGLRENLASGRIDCQIDPNRIRAVGALTGAGGIQAATGTTELGDAKVAILVTFQVNAPAPFSLVVAPRPDLHATDEFVAELKDLTRNNRLVSLDQTDPAQQVSLHGVLQPGSYSVRYRVEATFDADQTTRDLSLDLSMPSTAVFVDCNGNGVDDRFDIALGNAPDVNHDWVIDSCQCLGDWSGGGVSVQDIFDFLGDWFAGHADFDHSGTTTVQDLFGFLAAWFAGCP